MRFGAPKETLFKTMDSNFQESINIQDNNKYLNIHSRYRKLKNSFINSKEIANVNYNFLYIKQYKII